MNRSKIDLTDNEKQKLRRNRIRISDILNFAVDELEEIMDVPFERAKEIYALLQFQTIPSVGIRFAEDLIFLGYFSIEELKGKQAERLVEEFEKKKGYWIDPCVEDQFRLAVYYAETNDRTKRWWDFTGLRKQYRLENGYPSDRPTKSWCTVRG